MIATSPTRPTVRLRADGLPVTVWRVLDGGVLGDWKVLRADGTLMRIRAHEIDDGTPQRRSGLVVRPIGWRLAKATVDRLHRHHRAPPGHKFSLGLFAGAFWPAGVAIVGRPVARHLDDGHALEVTRLATDSTPNAPSMLLAAAAAEARRRGACRLITYTLPSESGVSLRAAGWHLDGPAGGGTWSRTRRQRADQHPTGRKLRWSLALTREHS